VLCSEHVTVYHDCAVVHTLGCGHLLTSAALLFMAPEPGTTNSSVTTRTVIILIQVGCSCACRIPSTSAMWLEFGANYRCPDSTRLNRRPYCNV